MKYKCSCGMDLSMIGRLFEIGNEIVRKKDVICNSSRSLKQN